MPALHVLHAAEGIHFLIGDEALLQQVLRKRDTLLGFGEHLAAVLRGEHADTQAIERIVMLLTVGSCLFGVDEAQELRSGNSGDTALDHSRACLLDACRVAGNEYARNRCGAVLVAHGDTAAALHHLAAGHVKQLRLRGKANGQADRVHIEVLFGALDELEVAVHLGDGNAGYVVFAFGLLDGVRCVERNTGARQLLSMHAVAANAWAGVNQSNHFAAGLQQLVAHHQANVAGAQHQHLVARAHPVQVHEHLGGAGTDDAGKRPPFEGNGVFRSTRCHDDAVRFVVLGAILAVHQHLVFGEDTHYHAAQLNVDARLSSFLQQILANGDAAQLRPVFLGAEELVDLLEQLAARTGVLVEYHHLKAVAGSGDGGAQAGRAGTHDDKVVSLHPNRLYSAASAPGFAETPYWVCTVIPARTGVMQVRTLGLPSTTITQSVQRPMAQNTPRGLSIFMVWRCTITPAALRAAAMGSPSYPSMGLPS